MDVVNICLKTGDAPEIDGFPSIPPLKHQPRKEKSLKKDIPISPDSVSVKASEGEGIKAFCVSVCFCGDAPFGWSGRETKRTSALRSFVRAWVSILFELADLSPK